MKIIRGGDKGFFANCNDVARHISQSLARNEQWFIFWGPEIPYHDATKGNNSWEYYFEQTFSLTNPNYEVSGCVELIQAQGSFRDTMNYIYKNYIKINNTTELVLKPYVELFKDKNVLGVHIRRTDKFLIGEFGTPPSQAPIDLDIFKKEINNIIDDYDIIYLATDCSEALDYMKAEYGTRLVYNTDCTRGYGTVSIHNNFKEISGYKKGLDVVVDAYNLANCNYLIRSTSNVSIASLYINNKLPFLNINDKYLNDNDGLL